MSIQELENLARSTRVYYEQNLLVWLDRLHLGLQEKSNPIESAITAVNSVLAFYVLLPQQMRGMVDSVLGASTEDFLEYIDFFIGENRLIFLPKTWEKVNKKLESEDLTPEELLNVSLHDCYELRRRALKVSKIIVDVLDSMGLLLWRKDLVKETL